MAVLSKFSSSSGPLNATNGESARSEELDSRLRGNDGEVGNEGKPEKVRTGFRIKSGMTKVGGGSQILRL